MELTVHYGEIKLFWCYRHGLRELLQATKLLSRTRIQFCLCYKKKLASTRERFK